MKMDFGRYLEIGERGYTLERMINNRFGITADNDKLPKRLTNVPQDPKHPETKVPLETMKKTYQPTGNDVIFIGHGDCLEDALYVRDLIVECFGPAEFVIDYIGAVIGAHSGPGTIALFHLGKKN